MQQPVLDGPGPQATTVNMRFDYLVRVRRATAGEVKSANEAAPGRTCEQREAVLFALRGLTGRDAGDTTEAWQRQCPDAELDSQAERLAAGLMRSEGAARQAGAGPTPRRQGAGLHRRPGGRRRPSRRQGAGPGARRRSSSG